MSEAEYQLLTRALCCLAATEPALFAAANALHSKLIFNKPAFLDAGNSIVDGRSRPQIPHGS